MVQYKKMKFAVLASYVLLATLPAIAARVDVPSLPPSPYADMEAATNITLNVNATRLER